jgi:hypothetical protein
LRSRHAWKVAVGVAALMVGVAVAVTMLGSVDNGYSTGVGAGDAGIDVEPDVAADMPGGRTVLARAADRLIPRADGAVFELGRAEGQRKAGSLRCKQLHVSPAGRGLCLALSGNGVDYEGVVFDRAFEPVRRFAIAGVPDRARVSRDGRYGAFTTFNRGSSRGYFANAEDFSTDTRIVDMATGEAVLRLTDQLEVTRAGRRVPTGDAQFWGVTFADGDRFYATMARQFRHLLIEGDARTGRARVLRGEVECPSLSPDGTRIAYKRRIRYTNRWRFHVLDLSSGEDVALAEHRSIDDQPEWLGDDRIVYSDDRSLFTVPADGGGEPELLARHAASPAAVSDRPVAGGGPQTARDR